jgi:ABC-2 type transport system ATP-binding protein
VPGEVTARRTATSSPSTGSFTADAGRVTAVLGPNGAGKTSTIEVLEATAGPTAGRSCLDPGGTPSSSPAGVMLQSGGAPRHPGHEVARLFCDLYGGQKDPDALALVGLTARAASRAAVGRRAARLALALAGRPEVVFLDEPTTSVDVSGRQVVRGVIRDLAAGGCCVLLTTHELDEASGWPTTS